MSSYFTNKTVVVSIKRYSDEYSREAVLKIMPATLKAIAEMKTDDNPVDYSELSRLGRNAAVRASKALKIKPGKLEDEFATMFEAIFDSHGDNNVYNVVGGGGYYIEVATSEYSEDISIWDLTHANMMDNVIRERGALAGV